MEPGNEIRQLCDTIIATYGKVILYPFLTVRAPPPPPPSCVSYVCPPPLPLLLSQVREGDLEKALQCLSKKFRLTCDSERKSDLLLVESLERKTGLPGSPIRLQREPWSHSQTFSTSLQLVSFPDIFFNYVVAVTCTVGPVSC